MKTNNYHTYRLPTLVIVLLMLIAGSLSACGGTSAPPTPLPTENIDPGEVSLSPTEIPDPIPTFVMPTSIIGRPRASGDVAHRWLQGIPCKAPCWEGITPGETTAEEAADILNRNSLITNLELYPRLNKRDHDLISWDWSDSEAGGGSLAFPHKSGPKPVSGIVIGASDVTYRLSEIIAAYGQPSHVLPVFAIAQDPHSPATAEVYGIKIIYLSQGFYLIGKDAAGKPLISPDLELFGRVTFFTPNRRGLDSALQSDWWDSTDMVPWQGFQDFDVYCQLAKSSSHHVCGGENSSGGWTRSFATP